MLSQSEKYHGLVVWTDLTDATPTLYCHEHYYTRHGEYPPIQLATGIISIAIEAKYLVHNNVD